MAAETARTPKAIWMLMAALALLQPATHLLILYAPPAGTAPTGLHIPDSALFLQSMDMFATDFYSPYATCRAERGDDSLAYYSVPHLWLYGVVGLLNRVIPLNPFLFYGMASGLGALFYLWVVYRFLRTIAPQAANLAFLFFAVGGGPGGVLYLATAALGLHGHPSFESYFLRFAMYDLFEGPHFNPVLYFPRLYYTLSLGICLGALTALIQWQRNHRRRFPWSWTAALAAGAFINARFGVFVGGLLVLWLVCNRVATTRDRPRLLLAYGLPCLVGCGLAWALMRTNPTVVANHLDVANMAMWFSPFLLTCALPFALGAGPLWQTSRQSDNRLVRIAVPALLGYFAGFALAYLAYQAYYGNLLTGRDGSVAARVSDFALLGALAGGSWGAFQKPGAADENTRPATTDWIVLWFLGFAALAISGFGQGWFLRFGPQRLQVLLWLPLSILAAQGLLASPTRWRRALTSLVLVMGTANVLVATLCFQAPVGRAHNEGPWTRMHPEVMRTADVTLLDALGDGTVLAPAPAGDVVVRKRGNPVVFGVGSFNLTGQAYAELRSDTETFFAPETTDAARRSLAKKWCADWIYAPATWPVAPATLRAMEKAPWLEVVAGAGDGAVFRVLRDGGDETL